MTATCGVCHVELPPARNGRKPKWCKEHRNTRAAHPEKRLADKLRFQRIKKPCPGCGQPCSYDAMFCRPCLDAAREEKRTQIVNLWSQGCSTGEIARAVGTTQGSLSVQIHTMRNLGYDLPYRYKMKANVRVG